MGANGLPLLGAGDWNDGIDALGRQGRGTSVWMGFFFYNVLDGFIPLAREQRRRGLRARAASRRARARCGPRSKSAGSGDHYALDFADDGAALDMPQCDDDRLVRLFRRRRLRARASRRSRAASRASSGRNRILLLEKPFFEHSQPYPGRIADYPPGVRENGGQYSHGASWIVDGFVRARRKRRARRATSQARPRLQRARVHDIREDLAAEEDRSRQSRASTA